MEFLILMMKVMLGVLGIWSTLILFSIGKMMVTVRSIRGMNRRSDWLEAIAVLSIFVGTITVWFRTEAHTLTHICPLIISFGTAALFFLFYISERHIQNLRNVKEIKRSLTKE